MSVFKTYHVIGLNTSFSRIFEFYMDVISFIIVKKKNAKLSYCFLSFACLLLKSQIGQHGKRKIIRELISLWVVNRPFYLRFYGTKCVIIKRIAINYSFCFCLKFILNIWSTFLYTLSDIRENSYSVKTEIDARIFYFFIFVTAVF